VAKLTRSIRSGVTLLFRSQ